MKMFSFAKIVAWALPLVLLIGSSQSKKLQTVFEWQQIDFKYSSADERDAAIQSGSFIPDNVIPVGIEATASRLFFTFPKLKPGVPASLAYIDLNGECFSLFVSTKT